MMAAERLLSALIRVRTALKTDQTDEALKTIRYMIKEIDPGRKIETAMREGPPLR